MNYTSLTLGELLSSDNPAIKRNAVGILKQLQKNKIEIKQKSSLTEINDFLADLTTTGLKIVIDDATELLESSKE